MILTEERSGRKQMNPPRPPPTRKKKTPRRCAGGSLFVQASVLYSCKVSEARSIHQKAITTTTTSSSSLPTRPRPRPSLPLRYRKSNKHLLWPVPPLPLSPYWIVTPKNLTAATAAKPLERLRRGGGGDLLLPHLVGMYLGSHDYPSISFTTCRTHDATFCYKKN